uniref:valine--tRNA ligase n=1 Tax=Timema cristinae TaxID=61476 RepID=A0A7R9CXY0_TIMCR|nr:unnamed protein product [Timema cristinae]
MAKGTSCLSSAVMLNPSVRTYRITSALEVLLDKKQLASMQADVKRDYLDFISKPKVNDYLKQFISSDHQISFDVSECHTNRLLCNKLWQATKYTLMCLDKATPEWPTIDDKHKMSIEQRWVLSRLGTAVAEVNTALEKADFHSATQAIRAFLHYELCDIYLTRLTLHYNQGVHVLFVLQESTKLAMKDSVNAPLTCGTLVRCLETTLLCLSPFMPYITEELYQRLPLQNKTDSIMVASYPCTHEVIMITFGALTLLECLEFLS